MSDEPTRRQDDERRPDEDVAAKQSSSDVKAPFQPHEDDDSAWGDTDQHSTA